MELSPENRDFSQASRVTISRGLSVLSSGCHGLGSHILLLPAVHTGQGDREGKDRLRGGTRRAEREVPEPAQAHSGALCPVPSARGFTYVRKLSRGRNISSLLLSDKFPLNWSPCVLNFCHYYNGIWWFQTCCL